MWVWRVVLERSWDMKLATRWEGQPPERDVPLSGVSYIAWDGGLVLEDVRLGQTVGESRCTFRPARSAAWSYDLTETAVTNRVAEEAVAWPAVEIAVYVNDPWDIGFCWVSVGGRGYWPLKEVVYIVTDDQSVVFPC